MLRTHSWFPGDHCGLLTLVAAAILSAVCGGGIGSGIAGADEVSVVPHPPTESRNVHYPGYRAPLVSTPLVELPLGAVQPHGWLRKQLELQAAGFHGHLGEISQFLQKKDNAWLSSAGHGKRGWEEVPYWLKGYILTAYLLEDPDMIKESNVWIEGALSSLKLDGWFGPRQVRSTVNSTKGKYDLWPNMVMLFCLQAYYEQTHDPRVIDLMTKYFRFELRMPDQEFLPPFWQQQRAADNLYSVYWLYNRTGDKWLLDLASKIHRHTARWTDGVANWHNVNMSQAFGGPTTYYVQSHDKKHLKASYRNYDEIRTKYGQVPGGMFGGDENCREGHIGPRQAIETCGIVEMMLSDETLVNITGDLTWADRCEDVAFNSLPAALTADFRALRYLTAPNMVLSDRESKSPQIQNGGPMFLMDPTRHRCCQHNFGHGWPYFATHIWSATADNGLAAVLYSASDVRAKVGPETSDGGTSDGGKVVEICQRTHYPFDDQIELTIEPAQPVSFPLYLRVPGWCENATLELNGQTITVGAKPRQFIRIQRRWQAGDKVVLKLPMRIQLRKWVANQNSISVDRGPLTYSLKIGQRMVQLPTSLKDWPAFEIHPTTPWNYGLIVDEENPGASFKVVQRAWPANNVPFTLADVPIELVGKGRRIAAWQMDDVGLVGALQASPVKSEAPVEPITLVPMGAARLRISAFPVIGTGPDAHRWTAPPKPRYRASASHCWGGDTARALCDGRVPKSSADHSIPRMTWWDHRGTEEWVQYDFAAPRDVTQVRVYWFDDQTTGGHCRPPVSWRVLYRTAAGNWKLVANASAFGVDADQFNVVTFDRVKTAALRLEAKLQNGFSGGILEWEVGPSVARHSVP